MKHLAILMLGTALATAPALAQTSGQIQHNTPAAGAQPNAGAAAGVSPAQAANVASANYVTQNDPDTWRTSELNGMTVYNERDEEIGTIDDVVIDRSGDVKAVVIGVGGFLGIGQRNVAVPFERLQWQTATAEAGRAATTGANTGTAAGGMTGARTDAKTDAKTGAGAATGTNTAAGTAAAPRTGAVPATGTTPATGAGAPDKGPGTARPADRAAADNRDAPRRAVLANATREELRNAPEFKYN